MGYEGRILNVTERIIHAGARRGIISEGDAITVATDKGIIRTPKRLVDMTEHQLFRLLDVVEAMPEQLPAED